MRRRRRRRRRRSLRDKRLKLHYIAAKTWSTCAVDLTLAIFSSSVLAPISFQCALIAPSFPTRKVCRSENFPNTGRVNSAPYALETLPSASDKRENVKPFLSQNPSCDSIESIEMPKTLASFALNLSCAWLNLSASIEHPEDPSWL